MTYHQFYDNFGATDLTCGKSDYWQWHAVRSSLWFAKMKCYKGIVLALQIQCQVLWQLVNVAANTMQVKTAILAERQSLEMPCVAPSLVGRPHRHTYFQSSRVAQATNWGAPQVLISLEFLVLGPLKCSRRTYSLVRGLESSLGTDTHGTVLLVLRGCLDWFGTNFIVPGVNVKQAYNLLALATVPYASGPLYINFRFCGGSACCPVPKCSAAHCVEEVLS